MINNGLQNIIEKAKYQATRIPRQIKGELGYSGYMFLLHMRHPSCYVLTTQISSDWKSCWKPVYMTTFIYHKQNIKPNGVQDESSIVLWDIKTCKDMQFDNSNNTKPTKTNKKNGSELRCSACVALRVTPVTNSLVRHYNFQSEDFSLTTRKPCVSSFHVNSNPLCRKSW